MATPGTGTRNTVFNIIADWVIDEHRIWEQLLPADSRVETVQQFVEGISRLQRQVDKAKRPIKLLKPLISKVALGND